MSTVKAIPEGYHTLTPSLVCKDAAKAIDFYKKAFNAKENGRMAMPDGRIIHAELQIGNSRIMLADPFPGMSAAPADGPSSASLFMYCENVDQSFDTAVKAGCQVTMPLADQFWGDRFGTVRDPFGHSWGLAQHIKDVSPEEMKRNFEQWSSQARAAGQS